MTPLYNLKRLLDLAEVKDSIRMLDPGPKYIKELSVKNAFKALREVSKRSPEKMGDLFLRSFPLPIL